MSARTITSKRSTNRSRSLTKTVTPCRARPLTIHSFPGLTGTPCANANDGDPFVIYDQVADRWVISDFAFPSFPGSSFWECIGVSQSPDPSAAAGPSTPYRWIRQIQHSLATIRSWRCGTMAGSSKRLFPDDEPVCQFTTFNGVRAYALDRASMLTGGPANAIGFTLGLAGVGDSYSFVAANFRTDPPPAGRDEMVLAIDSAALAGDPRDPGPRSVLSCRFCHPGKFHFRCWCQPRSECRDYSQPVRSSMRQTAST